MSSRTFTWNAYETQLASDLSEGQTSATVLSADNLTAPIYLVLDPDDVALREWVKVTAITGNTFDTIERGLAGSVGLPGVGVAHPSGASVRVVYTKQVQDDLFLDIEALEGDTGTIIVDLANHISNEVDPHAAAGYVKDNEKTPFLRLDGTSTMTGPVLLADGELTLPSLTFVNSPTTGFQLDSPDAIGISNAGVGSWLFNSAGNFISLGGVGAPIIAKVPNDLGLPAYTFSSDSTTGMFRDSISTRLSFADKGVLQFTTGSSVHAGIRFPNGTTGKPSISFIGDVSTGFYQSSVGVISISNAGVTTWIINSSGSLIAQGGNYAPLIVSTPGTVSLPAYTFKGDTNTGMYSDGSSLRFSVDGVEKAFFGATQTAFRTIPTDTTTAGPNVNSTSSGTLKMSTSKRASKKFIKPLRVGITDNLIPVTFKSKLKGDPDTPFAGFVYEDVVSVFDEADAVMNYDTRAIVAALVADLQDARKRVVALEDA